MTGINKFTGERISELEHTLQCVADVVSIQTGSLIGFPSAGSRTKIYRDKFMTPDMILLLKGHLTSQIQRQEPRFDVGSIGVSFPTKGKVRVVVAGTFRPTGEVVEVEATP